MEGTNEVSELEQWAATERQREALRAWEKHDRNTTHAAKELGVARETVRGMILSIKKRAAKAGYAPEHDYVHQVPDGYYAKGVSTQYVDGEVKSQWVKSQIDHDRQKELLEEAFQGLSTELPKREPVAPPLEKADPDLLNFFPITDAHLGMLAWGEECGDDWDLTKGEASLCNGFARMVDAAPRAQECVIAQMGDYLHSDSLEPVTPTSGHVLDQDTRFPKLAAVAVKTLRTLIETALAKHERVRLIIAEGNHDIVSSIWLRVMFTALYEQEERLAIDQSILPYYDYRHGETFLGVHHGHLKGIEGKNGMNLALLFADGDNWAGTRYRYIHTGHKHATKEDEVHGAILQQHPTFAARDAYAARHGWKSIRKMSAISYHKKHGEYSRQIITPSML